jgi:hypothetical protein
MSIVRAAEQHDFASRVEILQLFFDRLSRPS